MTEQSVIKGLQSDVLSSNEFEARFDRGVHVLLRSHAHFQARFLSLARTQYCVRRRVDLCTPAMSFRHAFNAVCV